MGNWVRTQPFSANGLLEWFYIWNHSRYPFAQNFFLKLKSKESFYFYASLNVFTHEQVTEEAT